jgi:solute carrier family 45 protein 1/2/4
MDVFVLKKLRNLSFLPPTLEDYNSVTRMKTPLELILLSLVVFGIEICYAAETAFVTPILQKIGVPVQYMSLVWGVSPLIGFFASPVLGSLSDMCTSRLGRRRPFIIVYSVGIVIGLLLTGYGHVIGDLLWSGQGLNVSVIVVTIIGVVLLDLNCDACQSPARAYLIDISQNSDHTVGLSMFTLMAGAGGAIGYVLGGIPWTEMSKRVVVVGSRASPVQSQQSSLDPANISLVDQDAYYQTDLAYNHKQTLFTCVAVLYVLCMLVSITSFKEIPLGDEGIDSSVNYGKLNDRESSASFESIQAVAADGSISTGSQQSNPAYQSSEPLKHTASSDNKPSHLKTLKFYLLSIVNMPSSLVWLCVTHGLCWMSLLCYSLYFTDFVGEEIYGTVFFSFNFPYHPNLYCLFYNKMARRVTRTYNRI